MWFGNQNVPVERRVNPKTNATTPHRSASGWPVADAFTMANNRANESFGFDGDVDDFFAVSGTPTPSYETTVASSNTKHVRVIKRTNTNKGRTPKSTEEAKRFRSVPPPVRCACVRVRAWYPVSVSMTPSGSSFAKRGFRPHAGFPVFFFLIPCPKLRARARLMRWPWRGASPHAPPVAPLLHPGSVVSHHDP